MTSKIFRAILTTAAVVLLSSFLVFFFVTYGYLDSSRQKRLADDLYLAAAGTQESGKDYLLGVGESELRLTWIDSQGKVLYDSWEDAEKLDNHASREEVQEALATGSGSSVRYSDTRMEKTIYQAVRLADGTVLRISVSSMTTLSLAVDMVLPVMWLVLLAILLSAVFARRMARRIVKPLNEMNLEYPLDNQIYEEITPLLHRVGEQHRQISRQMANLKQKTEELEQITRNMKEGLVLLDKDSVVLSINPAAKTLFGVDESCVGRDFLTVDRKQELRKAVDTVYSKGRSEVHAQRNGREYLFELSRIESQGKIMGAVILALDVTEQTQAQQNRREFSANVSHELKTPLQSIIGSAELLESGLVKPEDQPRFLGHIRQEATRLMNLVQDIIRLSQLDEGVELPKEPVQIGPVAQEIFQSLTPVAEKKQVTLKRTGAGFTMLGVRRLLYEILYNLTENAIKYNKPGGSVEVFLGMEAGSKVMRVKDTGIGIPAEHQARIFERFYRVDKSHSKQSGGTGLGLSIVKHAVASHKGTITLESQEEQGTTVTVKFP